MADKNQHNILIKIKTYDYNLNKVWRLIELNNSEIIYFFVAMTD
jgi:hypothetical protein